MAGGMHPRHGPGVPIGQRPVAGRHDEPELAQPSSDAFLRLMGRTSAPPATEPEPPAPTRPALSLAEPHVVVDTDEGTSAGLLVELDGDRARVVYAWDDEAGSQGLMETWLPAEYVTTEVPRLPVFRLPRVPRSR